jgi:hypothetical protein
MRTPGRLRRFQTMGPTMSERDWKEEQRSVLTRLFDSVFERREASEDQVKHDIQRLGTVNKRLDNED